MVIEVENVYNQTTKNSSYILRNGLCLPILVHFNLLLFWACNWKKKMYGQDEALSVVVIVQESPKELISEIHMIKKSKK